MDLKTFRTQGRRALALPTIFVTAILPTSGNPHALHPPASVIAEANQRRKLLQRATRQRSLATAPTARSTASEHPADHARPDIVAPAARTAISTRGH